MALGTHCCKNCTSIVSAVLTSGLLDVPHHGARQLRACPAGTRLLRGAAWLGRVAPGVGHSLLDAVLWHSLPLDSGEGSERAVCFVTKQIVHALS